MKTRATWIVAAACFALLGGAMAWLTHAMLGMERNQNRMAEQAALQEMARLALWRMESIASALVIEESARPPEQYRTFAAPEAMVDNKTYSSVPPGDLLTLSPLLREPSEHVLLHFEMDVNGVLRSPQVPQGPDLGVCQAIGIPGVEELARAGVRLGELRQLMDKSDSDNVLAGLLTGLKVPKSLTGNRALLWGLNGFTGTASQQIQAADSPSKEAVKQAVAPASPSPAAYPNLAQQGVNWKPEEVQKQQLDYNNSEAQARAVTVDTAREKASIRRNANTLNLQEFNQKTASFSLPAKAGSPPPAAALPASAAGNPPAGEPWKPAMAAMSDFQPLWLGRSLLLTRRVSQGGKEWIQGAWLNWEKLRGELLAAVADRFPGASLIAAPREASPSSHLLASLPVQLVPGHVQFAAQPFWSPLKVSLGIAWLCVLLAVAAVALVLRGMMALSERRASFVSSVTHELRTPLATFKLYSEMLADGMVREEAKRQQYLETLTGEADRLGHLVENVLAYSRIERGKGPAAAAALPLRDLIDRIEPRLNQRALMAGMDFSMEISPDVMASALRTDAGAVEQILCNLVDNACKYGRHDGQPGRIELIVNRDRRRVGFTVRDHGPGIPRGDQNTIFLPFHKSARDAAHSAPGVGLGLALCRRLAAELRGSLEIDRSWTHGAAFVLKLPV